MSFEKTFTGCIETNLSTKFPEGVKGFVFNLYEYEPTHGTRFGIDFVGTGSFDADDSDWACDEIWEPAERTLMIPESFSGTQWKECQSRIHELLVSLLRGNSKWVAQLKAAQCIALGFAAGDLDIVWNA